VADTPVLRLAESWKDFRQLRILRNECREFMTHDQREFGLRQQFGFWLYHQTLGYRVYLLRQGDTPVAYGIIHHDKGFDWISGGVAAAWRGKGYGKAIFSFLTNLAAKPAYLDVFWQNIKARNLYRRLGWIEFERVDTALGTILVMCHDGT